MIRAGALLLLSCGSNNMANHENPAPADVSSAIDAIAARQCEKIFDCCSSDEIDDVFAGTDAKDQASCEAAVRAQAQVFFRPSLERSIDEGRVETDEDGLTECLAALDDRSCADYRPAVTANVLGVPGCEAFVNALLPLSSFCSEDFECETGFCAVPDGESEGACKNAPAPAEPCLNDRCREGLYCTDSDVCAEKLGEGDVCTRNADCQSDVCAPNEDGEFVCAVLPEICGGA